MISETEQKKHQFCSQLEELIYDKKELMDVLFDLDTVDKINDFIVSIENLYCKIHLNYNSTL